MNRLRAWFAVVMSALRENSERKNDVRRVVVCRYCKHMWDAGAGAYCSEWTDRQPWIVNHVYRTKKKKSRLCVLINTKGRCRAFEEGAPFIYRDGIGVISPPEEG